MKDLSKKIISFSFTLQDYLDEKCLKPINENFLEELMLECEGVRKAQTEQVSRKFKTTLNVFKKLKRYQRIL